MDNETISYENKILALFAGAFLAIMTVVGILVSYSFDLVYVEKAGFINVASFLGFIVICFVGLVSYRIYFLFLPFVLLAFPTAANDFFPSVYLGKSDELGASLFPFITHIDVYLVIGILKKVYDQKGKVKIQIENLGIIIIILFLISSLVNIATANESHQFALLICGLYPIRYIFLLALLTSNYEIHIFERSIVTGIIFSIFFLLAESYIYTYVTRNDLLMSGTLGTNTFANITAAILVFVIYLKRNGYRISFAVYGSLLVSGVVIIIFSETRMAILAGIIAFFLIQIILFKVYKALFILLTLGVVIIAVYNLIEVPDRYSVSVVLDKIHVNRLSWNISEMISIDRSWETSSIFSRLKLYQTSVNMFSENPFWGIGYGTFNYLKNDFGFDEYVLIDAHNGYLSTIAQMGMSSIFFLYFIYLYPIFNFKKIETPTYLKYLFVINLTMAIADLSNAGIYKTSVFALLGFNCFVIMALKRKTDLKTN